MSMPAIALIGVSTAGGGLLQNNPAGVHVKFGGKEVAVTGCKVAKHSSGTVPHGEIPDDASTVTGSSKVKVKGMAMVLDGDLASCGDTVIAGTSGITSN